MEVIIVPCTDAKIWDEQPDAGRVAAKNAYTKPVFLKWKEHAEKSGSVWFILSTWREYGLIKPDHLIENYDRGISAACGDQVLKDRLRAQGEEHNWGKNDRVILLDCDWFEPLVKAAIGDGGAQYELREICYRRK